MDGNERYSRHYKLAGFGEKGQEQLRQARVLVIGAGGLGCPALQYLAAAGVGSIGVVDHDNIELSNLQRHVLYSTEEIGRPKATVAAAKLRLLNPDIEIQEYVRYLSVQNAVELVQPYDIILDGSDNFSTRYLLSDLCALLKKPLIFGAIYRYEGQVAIFNVADDRGAATTYRHLFPEPPAVSEVPDCNEAGVLGVLPGIIGTMQAAETIKLITGVGQPLINKMMTISLLDYRSIVLDIPSDPSHTIRAPESLKAFQSMDYAALCGWKDPIVAGIRPEELLEVSQKADTLIVDIREWGELPRLLLPHLQVPLSVLPEQWKAIEQQHLIIVCQSGKRSLSGARLLIDTFGNTRHISHLEGGVTALQAYQHGKETKEHLC